jgi:hypothetical protein
MLRGVFGSTNGLSARSDDRNECETVPVDEVNANARVRKLALSLPGVAEHVSHGAPCFFVGDKRPIYYFHDHHGGDDRVTIWCPASRNC